MTIQKMNSWAAIRELLYGVDRYRTTIFFDIDDTLIKHKGAYCPNLNFRQNLKIGNWTKELPFRVTKDGYFMSYCDPDYLDIVRDYNNAILHSKWKLTDSELPYLFKEINRSDYHYYFLTSRGVEIHKPTKETLSSFKLLPKPRNRMDTKEYTNFSNVTGRSGIRGNIIYCGGYDKCLLLRENLFPCFPTVVMIDDNLDNLQRFDDYLRDKKGLTFIGIHYHG